MTRVFITVAFKRGLAEVPKFIGGLFVLAWCAFMTFILFIAARGVWEGNSPLAYFLADLWHHPGPVIATNFARLKAWLSHYLPI